MIASVGVGSISVLVSVSVLSLNSVETSMLTKFYLKHMMLSWYTHVKTLLDTFLTCRDWLWVSVLTWLHSHSQSRQCWDIHAYKNVSHSSSFLSNTFRSHLKHFMLAWKLFKTTLTVTQTDMNSLGLPWKWESQHNVNPWNH